MRASTHERRANEPLKPETRRRRSLRLAAYDYANPGAYFVTVCAQDRVCLFGGIADQEMRLNDAGRAIERWLLELPNKFPHASLDAHVVMPNQLHCIIVLAGDPVGADPRVRPGRAPGEGGHAGPPLPAIIHWFKTMSTNAYIRGVREVGWPSFDGRLWQRNYYEHVIRDDNSLFRIRQYIADNPAKWDQDQLHPGYQAKW